MIIKIRVSSNLLQISVAFLNMPLVRVKKDLVFESFDAIMENDVNGIGIQDMVVNI